MKIIITEGQLLLFEDRKQFENLISKRKTTGKPVKDEDVKAIEELSITDGYLVLFAKLYFTEIDKQNDGYVAKQRLKSISNILKERPNIVKVLPKQLFQYNDIEELNKDLKSGIQTLAAKNFYKKIPQSLKSEEDVERYWHLMARADIKIKEHNIENIVFKKVSKFDTVYQFLKYVDNIIENLSSYEDTLEKYQSSRHVKLLYKNEEEKCLLYVAMDEIGFDDLTDGTIWCISQDYGGGYIANRNDYSNGGQRTFFRLYNFLAEKQANNSIGFFVGKGNYVNYAYNASDDSVVEEINNFLEDFQIDLSKYPRYTYDFEPEHDDEEYEDDEEHEDEEEENINKLRFKHLAEIFDYHFNTSLSFSYNNGVLTDQGQKFRSLLTATVKGEGDSTGSDMMNHMDFYSKTIESYFPSKIKVSTKQVIKFFENYYGGFKFNYQHTGQDLFGDVSTTTVKEPLEQFMQKLIELGLPINLNESVDKNKVIITESTVSRIKIIKDLEQLAPEFAQAGQKVYDRWCQDEEGYCEDFGHGGICDEIAADILHIIQKHTDYNCFSNYNEHDMHTSVYVYQCDENPDEDGNRYGILIHIDIPYYHYEKGAAYTWAKIPNVKFVPSMVEIYDMSGYFENYVDGETCEVLDF